MQKITLGECIHRIGQSLEEGRGRLAFFLGAGCSHRAGVPLAGELVARWTGILVDLTGEEVSSSPTYGELVDRLFLTPTDGWREVEKLTAHCHPTFGHAALAQLMAHPRFAPLIPLVMTTNFDNIVVEAMYFYGQGHPWVAPLAWLDRRDHFPSHRPWVIQIPPDDPLVPPPGVESLGRGEFPPQLPPPSRWMAVDALVMLGYGGREERVLSLLRSLPRSHFSQGVYWVNEEPPPGPLQEWLDEHSGIWVNHLDFDRFFFHLISYLSMSPLSIGHWENVVQPCLDTWHQLVREIEGEEEGKELWEVWADEARAKGEDHLAAAMDHWEEGREKFGSSPGYLVEYARFCQDRQGDLDRAEELYREALEGESPSANALHRYGAFLCYQRGDLDRGEEFFLQALEMDPENADALGNYAVFLSYQRGETDRAHEFYERALEVDPHHGNNAGNYAVFSLYVLGDVDRAEELYQKALEADPHHPGHLGNYAYFLRHFRRDTEGARRQYDQALASGNIQLDHLVDYASLLRAEGDWDGAEKLYRRGGADEVDIMVEWGRMALWFQRDSDRGKEILDQVQDRAGEDPDVLGEVGHIWLWSDLGRAESVFDEVQKIEGDHEPSRLGRALVHLGRGEREECLQELKDLGPWSDRRYAFFHLLLQYLLVEGEEDRRTVAARLEELGSLDESLPTSVEDTFLSWCPAERRGEVAALFERSCGNPSQ